MAGRQRFSSNRGRVLLCFLLGTLWDVGSGQIRYSMPEEMEKGSFVGDIAKDLGLEPHKLSERGARIVSRGKKQYFALNVKSGSLVTADRIDREELCGKASVCTVKTEILLEDKVKIYEVEVEIIDVNDNIPSFGTEEREIKIRENTLPGKKFPLPEAFDLDVGVNSVQKYRLSPNHHFSLHVQTGRDDAKYPEMVLEQTLDREEISIHHLTLTASDGGNPSRSATVLILVIVLDANDNAPVFTQFQYSVSVPENVPVGTCLLRVNATDPDEGMNGDVSYYFRKITEKTSQLFELNSLTGDITVLGNLDYEECNFYDIDIEAQDGAGLLDRAKVLVTILDVNDNAPEMTVASVFSPVLENSESGTVVAFLKIRDRDSGENGEVICYLQGNIPFQLESSSKNFYKVLTDGALDREQTPEYNITVIATDKGIPPLSTNKTFILHIADVNDNAPVFLQPSYVAYVPENNPSGASISCVSAVDPDLEQNGRLSYSVVSSDLAPLPLSSYVSVSVPSGEIFAQRSFDYEQVSTFELMLQACDAGSPALCDNVTLRVFIVDRNDNAPIILYPALEAEGSALFDTVPRSAETGYLVTKVVAVDSDSGHNAWLAYRVLQATDPGLFSLGLRTGEVRTARALADRDSARHRLLISVQDGGQPPLSATVTLHLIFADSVQEALPEMKEEHSEIPDPQSELQFYLIVALALISILFLFSVILATVLCLRKSSSSKVLGCFRTDLCSHPSPGRIPNYSEGTLPYSYNLCVASQLGKMEYNFLKLTGDMSTPQDLLFNDSSSGLNNSTGESKIISDFLISSHASGRRCLPIRENEKCSENFSPSFSGLNYTKPQKLARFQGLDRSAEILASAVTHFSGDIRVHPDEETEQIQKIS
ncbi:protocadherin gamma-B1-like [Gracilinanus agilis]|uniref:protocadherin gamma-B1-like n=1 Tax=Gracilinanus agilis TaxID=191870 RepID=UPI001CFE137B|nr:protocadherin gamma-B1-like [Gracilinanus agilis]